MHSVRIELAKLILVGTRITYQATGDAGFHMTAIIARKIHLTKARTKLVGSSRREMNAATVRSDQHFPAQLR